MDNYLGVPLLGYKDIVCGSETSDYEDLERYILDNELPNFGFALPICTFPLDPDEALPGSMPQWHSIAKKQNVVKKLILKQD